MSVKRRRAGVVGISGTPSGLGPVVFREQDISGHGREVGAGRVIES
ncbi:hypothetical protein [Haloactinomyces albus]|uniref:Uncharacterized protein n=1 Tax=Haloactinomyces albus TaxID=1352928 RepID=A0AAE3ZEH2_9ACTN|nr:hypothetical protein [Haloactinomyces albus]MDR7303441.1 hypothetical protein [Haloactinomyces albus]